MTDEPPIRHVSDTAFMIAQHRALESARPDALFSDPLAARLAGSRGAEIVKKMKAGRMTGWTVAIRTRVIDAYITEAIARGVDTVVNLGAGLDTRPYRLPLPPTLTWIEVDYPDVIAFKEAQLQGQSPRCRLERVGLDLAHLPERQKLLSRIDAGARRIQVLTEGVVPYLDVEAAGSLADDLRALRHVESWIVDYIAPEVHAYRKRAGTDQQMREAPFKFLPSDWGGFFAAHGWKIREARYLPIEGRQLGRPVPLPLPIRAVMKILGPFTPTARRQRFARFAGYMLMEPIARSS
jgi:methyltransferase (TIGR00027 family)